MELIRRARRIADKLERVRVDPRLAAALDTGEEDVAPGRVAPRSVSENDLKQIEAQHRLSLPAEYRAFLLACGDTPLGPGCSGTLVTMEGGFSEESGEPFPLTEPLRGTISPEHERLPESERWDDFLCRSRALDGVPLSSGIKEVCDYGCAMYARMILGGPRAGQVWCLSGDIAYYGPFGGMEELHVGSGESHELHPTGDYDFMAWYELWLDAILMQMERL